VQPWYPRCPPRFGLVAPVRAGLPGGPTSDQVRGPGWRQVSHGLYVPSDTEERPEQRIVEAAARLPATGMVTGWAALRLALAAWFDGAGRGVPVLLPHASRIRAPGLEVVRTRRRLPTPIELYGVRCAPPPDALAHELRREPDLGERVVMLDMALLARVVTMEQVHALPEAATRGATSYATGQCRSAPEVRMSMVWQLDAGCAPPLMNREVLDQQGRLVAVVDLLDSQSPTYGEYDGEMHRTRSRHRRDTERAEALRSLGLESFTVVAGDSRTVQVRRMIAARDRAAYAFVPRRWRVGRHVPMRQLSPDLTTEEVERLAGWGTNPGS
jgi:hypothetical protein